MNVPQINKYQKAVAVTSNSSWWMEFGNAAKGNLRFWKASKVEGKPWVCRHLDGDWGQHQRSFQLLFHTARRSKLSNLSLGVCVAQSTALWKTVTCSSMNNLAWGRHTLIAESFCQRRYLVSVLTVVVGVFTFLCSMSSWENMTTPEMVRTSGWSYS